VNQKLMLIGSFFFPWCLSLHVFLGDPYWGSLATPLFPPVRETTLFFSFPAPFWSGFPLLG